MNARCTLRRPSPLDLRILAALPSYPTGATSAVLSERAGCTVGEAKDATYTLHLAGYVKRGIYGWRLTMAGRELAEEMREPASAVFETPLDDRQDRTDSQGGIGR